MMRPEMAKAMRPRKARSMLAWGCGLRGFEDPRDVARLHHGQPLIAVLGREALEQGAPHPLCGGRELVAELLRIEIGGATRIHAAGLMAFVAHRTARAGARLVGGAHECGRTS